MRKFCLYLLSFVLLFVYCCPIGGYASDAESSGFYFILRDGYTDGDSEFAVDLYMHDDYEFGIAYFGLNMNYSRNIVLREAETRCSGVILSQTIVDTPFKILGVSSAENYFEFPFEDTLIASFTFSIIDMKTESPAQIFLEVDPELGIGDQYSDDLSGDIDIENFEMEIKLSGDDYVEEDPPIETPDFDDLNYTGSDSIYVNGNFMTAESFARDFMQGSFYIENGLMCGWAEAKTLQSNYTNVNYEGNTIFNNDSPYVWRTYDASITLSLSDDKTVNSKRWINLCYCNDNMVYAGTGSDRQFITFSYDVENKCFRLANGWNNSSPGGQFMNPVYKDICTDGSEYINIGMSVEKNRIRCFYNGEKIFDYTNSDFRIARWVGSPFLLWNEGNVVKATNVTVAKQGYLFPENGTATEGYVVGTDGLLVNYYGKDTAEIPDTVKKISKFAFLKCGTLKTVSFPKLDTEIENGTFFGAKDLTIRCYALSTAKAYADNNSIKSILFILGDIDGDGALSLADVTNLSRKIAGGSIEIINSVDMDMDGTITLSDLTLLRRTIAG